MQYARPLLSRGQPVIVGILLLGLQLLLTSSAFAATFRTHVARVPDAPLAGDTVRVWMNSDTAFGETAGIEYNVGSSYVKVLGSFDTSYPGANWRADIPAFPAGTFVRYQLFTRNQSGSDYGFTGFNWSYTVTAPPATTIPVAERRALWLDADTIAWNASAASSYKLLYDPDGAVTTSAADTAYSDAASPGFLPLTVSGTVNGASYPKNPNAGGLIQLTLPAGTSAATVKDQLCGQIVVAAYDGSGALITATGVQIQGVLDDLYATAAAGAELGVHYNGGVPTVRLWAPTAKNVTLRRFDDSTTATFSEHAMGLDPASGVWSVTGDASWDRDFYLFAVEVYVPETDAVETNLVTDPYALSLSANSLRNQFVNLGDADLEPAGWDTLTKPALAAFEDIAVYEMHVRDFSINDSTVDPAHRGTYLAFTYDGDGPDANTELSDGMNHLLQLQDAGLTHVHLLPVFDIASVDESNVPRTVDPAPTGYARESDQPQTVIGAARADDGFNWGYDPLHYGAPEGSYSTDPDGVARILEFRRMVSALNRNGLRVVMDVVYNHTNSAGQSDPKSVLDKIVPGYYYRYTLTGALEQSSCCPDTAAEYAMFEKLMIDTLEIWARDYKIDGFRFDLMNLHTVENAVKARNAVQTIDPSIYVYGEGWDFGSAAAKGLHYAKQANMAGTGIGTFNDRLRDAAHGGYSTDSLGIRQQGFINGLSYDWNGYFYANRFQSHLHERMDVLRSALRASGVDWNGHGDPYTADPQESVPYVSKHDNETFFDQNIFKLPNGESGTPITGMADRVRVQNLGLSLVGLAQGVPFFHMGSDILRSKSLDRNSYDSGDWFNRVDWSYADGSYDNNFGVGLPPAWDNQSRWPIMGPLLADGSLSPSAADAQANAAYLREILRIRGSSPLFRLRSEDDVNSRVSFYNGNNGVDGLIIMALADTLAPDLDPNYETILVFFNANKTAQSFTIPNANSFSLHPIHTDGVDDDPVVQGATFNDATDAFTIPARTTAVFVSAQPIAPPSGIDWVGELWPLGGVSHRIPAGDAAGDFTVYVQVYEPGITGAGGSHAGIDCALHWGRYGETWSDLPMTRNTGFSGNTSNDEYMATIPAATLDALAVGTYGFTAYCTEDGLAKKWRDGEDGILAVTPAPAADTVAPTPAGGVFVHLFEWTWNDIAQECAFLAEKGFTAVQVSPPMEHVPAFGPDYPWWVRYQPVTHDAAKLVSRSGTLVEFQDMVDSCNALGVEIYVDAVINHTTGVGSGTGTDGSTYTPYTYPQYGPDDFHACGTPGNDIQSYGSRTQVQSCELVNLADLKTGKASVQDALRAYLQDLLEMGVAGFRIDASKHMAAQDIAAILDGLERPDGSRPYVFQEVIDQGGEPVKSFEYTPSGDVTEFRYSVGLGAIFNGCSGSLSDLQNFGSDFLDSAFAVVFTDNHDNQRGHGAGGACVLDHRDGNALYNLGNIFMLAYPYGYPSVMSSYYWSNNPASDAGDSKGPPTMGGGAGTAGETRNVYANGEPINCADSYADGKWVCEHRRPAIANMVAFRAVTEGEPLTDWWDNGGNAIAFGRGEKGYVAINRTGSALTRTFQTSLPAGIYCDVTKGERLPNGQCSGPTIEVNASSQIVDGSVAAMDAFAIHIGAQQEEETTVVYGSIESFVWFDVDGDGLQESGEPAQAGVAVELLDSSGVLSTTTTAADGVATFAAAPVGRDLRLRFTVPANRSLTVSGVGNDALNSDALTDGATATFQLTLEGQVLTSVDAGLVYAAAYLAQWTACGVNVNNLYAMLQGRGVADLIDCSLPGQIFDSRLNKVSAVVVGPRVDGLPGAWEVTPQGDLQPLRGLVSSDIYGKPLPDGCNNNGLRWCRSDGWVWAVTGVSDDGRFISGNAIAPDGTNYAANPGAHGPVQDAAPGTRIGVFWELSQPFYGRIRGVSWAQPTASGPWTPQGGNWIPHKLSLFYPRLIGITAGLIETEDVNSSGSCAYEVSGVAVGGGAGVYCVGGVISAASAENFPYEVVYDPAIDDPLAGGLILKVYMPSVQN